MSRKKKLVNNTTIPQYAIERFARCVFDDIRADYAKPEVQADFQRWLAEREANKKTRVAKTATLVSFSGNKQIIRTRFRFGRYGSDYIALVRRKGLVCVAVREWTATKVRLGLALAGGAHPHRI